jgi:hypothetical protein
MPTFLIPVLGIGLGLIGYGLGGFELAGVGWLFGCFAAAILDEWADRQGKFYGVPRR